MFEDMRNLHARAERLARAHRAPFDAAYDNWHAAGRVGAAPDIDDFMADIDDAVLAALGPERAGRVRAAIEAAEREQDWEAHDALVEAAGGVYGVYLTEFEYGMK